MESKLLPNQPRDLSRLRTTVSFSVGEILDSEIVKSTRFPVPLDASRATIETKDTFIIHLSPRVTELCRPKDNLATERVRGPSNDESSRRSPWWWKEGTE